MALRSAQVQLTVRLDCLVPSPMQPEGPCSLHSMDDGQPGLNCDSLSGCHVLYKHEELATSLPLTPKI